jgi:hypothetical protein
MLIHMADQEELRSVIDRAGPLSLIFVVALGIAVFVIARSMNRQMKRINPDLPKGVDEQRRAADERYTEEAVERGEHEAAAEQGEDEQPRA